MIQNMKIGGDCEHGYPVGHMCPECDRKAELITPTANTKEIAERCAEAWFSPREKFSDEHFPFAVSEEDRKQARIEFVDKILPVITEAITGKEGELNEVKRHEQEQINDKHRMLHQYEQQLTAERERVKRLEDAIKEAMEFMCYLESSVSLHKDSNIKVQRPLPNNIHLYHALKQALAPEKG